MLSSFYRESTTLSRGGFSFFGGIMTRKKNRGNGQGSVVRVSANNYKAIVTVGYKDGDPSKPIRRTKSGFATKSEAYDYIPILKKEVRAEKMTLASIYETFREASMPKLSLSQQGKLERARKRLDDIWFVDLKLLGIKDLQNCIKKNATTYYTARDCKVLLSHLYTRACAEQYVVNNLAQFIELPSLEETEQEPFNDAEISAFWKDFEEGNVFTGYILLMIYTGMMPGELFECQKSMVDLPNRMICGAGKKTKKRKETPIVLASFLVPVVEALMKYSDKEALMPHYKTTFYDFYNRTIERLKIRPLPPYSCRHTTATALARIENNPEIIKEVMRHTQIQTTQRYIHLDATPMKDAVEKLRK